MSTQIPPNLSLRDKGLIVAVICRARMPLPLLFPPAAAAAIKTTVVGTGLYTFLLSPFRGSSGAKSITKHVKLAVARSLLENLTIAQSQ